MEHLDFLKSELYEEINYAGGSTENIKCDIAVVGGGGCGLVCAVRAAEQGASVVVLEKAPRTGGNTFMAGIYKAVNTREDLANGVPDPTEEMFKRDMQFRQWGKDPRIVWENLKISGTVFDWFTDKGLKWDKAEFGMDGACYTLLKPEHPYENNRDPSHGPGYAGSHITDKMLSELKRLGVPVITKARAERLLEKDGKVIGVVARTPEHEIRVEAKAVVLASGGFAANEELVRKWFPWHFVKDGRLMRISNANATGDAIPMAAAVGAKTMENVWMGSGGMTHHPYSFSIHTFISCPHAVRVNIKGKRFMDESAFDSERAMQIQPEGYAYVIFDEEMKNFAYEFMGHRVNAQQVDGYSTFNEDIERELKHPGKIAVKADTIEELALKLGMPEKALYFTMLQYNEFCEKGKDELTLKDPKYLRKYTMQGPFYAFLAQRMYTVTVGGVSCDHDMRVVNDDLEPIPGLYTGGDCSSGGGSISGVAWAVNSGYLCAEHALEYIGLKERKQHH